MLNNPLIVLENANQGKTFTNTQTLTVSAQLVDEGSGIVNIAFLLGKPFTGTKNAQVTSFTNTFWIETVQYEIDVPISTAGQQLAPITPSDPNLASPVPAFSVIPPHDITQVTPITVSATQIQYFQEVKLFFAGVRKPIIQPLLISETCADLFDCLF